MNMFCAPCLFTLIFSFDVGTGVCESGFSIWSNYICLVEMISSVF